MLAVNYTNLRDNMKAYMDKVTDDYETLILHVKIIKMWLCCQKKYIIILWKMLILWEIKQTMIG